MRLSHKILTQPLFQFSTDGQREEIDPRDLRESVKKSEIIIADSVGDLYYSSEKAEWDWFTDIPNMRPPFDSTFIELNIPDRIFMPEKDGTGRLEWRTVNHKTQVGYALEVGGENEKAFACKAIGIQGDSFRWAIIGALVIGTAGRILIHTDRIIFLVKEDGALALPPQIMTGAKLLSQTIAAEFIPAGLAVSFMQCKNVSTPLRQEENPPPTWFRRANKSVPRLKYRILAINPMREILHSQGGLAANGLKKALHICRGHFATYSEDRPLFGKFTGTFWKPQHVRGLIDYGAVIKDYKIET